MTFGVSSYSSVFDFIKQGWIKNHYLRQKLEFYIGSSASPDKRWHGIPDDTGLKKKVRIS